MSEDRARVDWQKMDTVPRATRVLLWLDKGEKGNGQIDVGIICEEGEITCYWTWGGPNSGSDIDEVPTAWALLPYTPDGEVHD